jgi:hypothetical protein
LRSYLVSGSTIEYIYTQTVLFQPLFESEPRIDTVGSLGVSTFSFGFTDGRLDLGAVMSGFISCRTGLGMVVGGSCSSSLDFLSSLRFTGASVFDAGGNAVSTSITSSSGFDYATGLPPHGEPEQPPSVIPLPASVLLLLSGMGAIALLRKRRRVV